MMGLLRVIINSFKKLMLIERKRLIYILGIDVFI